MALIKLNRINKGGEIIINSEHITYFEVEGRSTTIHLVGGLLFSVEESVATVAERIENQEITRIAEGIKRSGGNVKPG
ncbi:MAG: hypothetical protein RLY20_1178 [Verrucomicrobiota bacterium]|jgi:uncharacterized protein YlzI (FlbEa/FlbD family)